MDVGMFIISDTCLLLSTIIEDFIAVVASDVDIIHEMTGNDYR